MTFTDDKKRSMSAGINMFLPKPVKRTILEKKVLEVISAQH
jgi:hypothetical protein